MASNRLKRKSRENFPSHRFGKIRRVVVFTAHRAIRRSAVQPEHDVLSPWGLGSPLGECARA